MTARFYCADLSGADAVLNETESHHALHVLRMREGDEAELFDGGGITAEAVIEQTDRRCVRLRIRSRRTVPLPQRPSLTVAAAVPRGDRLRSMIEKLTELGVDRVIPLRTQRSVADPRPGRIDRLQATVISAMKQSGRNHLLKVDEAMEFSVVLRNAAGSGQVLYMAHPGRAAEQQPVIPERDALLLIGPEGGFTSEEVLQAADYGAHRLIWPEGILRIETAAVVFSALLLSRLHG